MKNLRNDEINKIKNDFISSFSLDENIASLRDEKNGLLKELSDYLGIKKTLIGKTYRHWSKARKGDEGELEEIQDFLLRLEEVESDFE